LSELLSTKKPVIPANAGIHQTSVLHPDHNRYIQRFSGY